MLARIFLRCPGAEHVLGPPPLRPAVHGGQVKADNPGIAFTDISKELGTRWKALDSDGRAEFEEQAATDKQRYQQELAAYKAQQAGDDL